jgi:hypothetical protein
MSVLSVTCCALLSAVCAFTLVSASGCGTDAKGVDDCRDIEEARCSAAPSCGLLSDVDECKRFYRDQCLHGLAVSPPSGSVLKSCVATITNAGLCAMGDAGTELSDCTPPVSSSAPGAETACDIVNNPEKAVECSFLAPGADAGSADSGTGGSSGSNEGGSSGSEDAAGSGGTAGI